MTTPAGAETPPMEKDTTMSDDVASPEPTTEGDAEALNGANENEDAAALNDVDDDAEVPSTDDAQGGEKKETTVKTSDAFDGEGTSDTNSETEVVDPSSYPRNPQGLEEFLAAVDGKDKETAAPVSTYQANAVYVKAGSSKEIRIPIFAPGKAQWEAGVEESDVTLDVRLEQDGDSVINLGDSLQIRNDLPCKGEFHITSVPSTIVLKFDNSYSWVTPKNVSYRVKMTPPIDEKRKQRIVASLKKVRFEIDKTTKAVAIHAKNRQQAHVELEQCSKELKETEQSAVERMQKYNAIQKESEKEMREAQQMQKALDEMETKLEEEERQLQELEKRIKELELERRVREEERDALKGEMQQKKAHAEQMNAQAEKKKDEGEEHLKQVKMQEQDLLGKREKVDAITKARNDAAEQENRHLPELEHFKRQEVALESRLHEHI